MNSFLKFLIHVSIDETTTAMTFKAQLHQDENDKLVDFRPFRKPSEYIFLNMRLLQKNYKLQNFKVCCLFYLQRSKIQRTKSNPAHNRMKMSVYDTEFEVMTVLKCSFVQICTTYNAKVPPCHFTMTSIGLIIRSIILIIRVVQQIHSRSKQLICCELFMKRKLGKIRNCYFLT